MHGLNEIEAVAVVSVTALDFVGTQVVDGNSGVYAAVAKSLSKLDQTDGGRRNY